MARGHVFAEIELSNPRQPQLKPLHVRALADTGALVFGDEVLLGSVPMEDLDLVVARSRRSITVNPESPNIPQARVKSVARSRHPATTST